MAMAGNSVAGANFAAYDGSDPLVNIAATGQTESYAPGDDGDLKKGVAWPEARFIDNGDGTVTDGLTGLTWLKRCGMLCAGGVVCGAQGCEWAGQREVRIGGRLGCGRVAVAEPGGAREPDRCVGIESGADGGESVHECFEWNLLDVDRVFRR